MKRIAISGATLQACLAFLWRPTVTNWRNLRRVAMSLLPKQERKENGDSL